VAVLATVKTKDDQLACAVVEDETLEGDAAPTIISAERRASVGLYPLLFVSW